MEVISTRDQPTTESEFEMSEKTNNSDEFLKATPVPDNEGKLSLSLNPVDTPKLSARLNKTKS